MRFSLKDLQDGLNLIVIFFNIQLIQTSIKNILIGILKVKTRNCIKRFSYRLIKNILRKKCKKGTKLDDSLRSTSTRSNSGGQTSNWSICFVRSNRIKSSGLTGETRASVTPENVFQKRRKRKKENIPSYVSTKKGSNSKSGFKKIGLQKD